MHSKKIKIYELLYDAIKRNKLSIFSENYCNSEYIKGVVTVINILGLSNDCVKYFNAKGYAKTRRINLEMLLFCGTTAEFNGIKLVKTCVAYPEQYYAYKNDKKVGFLRLRNGEFTVSYPSCDGQVIYSACPSGDGYFLDNEREMFLKNACLAIAQHIQKLEIQTSILKNMFKGL